MAQRAPSTVIAFHGDPAALESVPRAARTATLLRGGVRYVVRFASVPTPPIEPGLIDNPSEVSAAVDVVRTGTVTRHARFIVEWDDSHCCLVVHAFAWAEGDAKASLAVADPVENVPSGSDAALRFDLADGAVAFVLARRTADGRLALRLNRIAVARARR